MASDLERGCNEHTINSQFGHVLYQAPGLIALSSEAFHRSSKESNISQSDGAGSSSSHTLATDDSRYYNETRRCSSGTEDTDKTAGIGRRSPAARGSYFCVQVLKEPNQTEPQGAQELLVPLKVDVEVFPGDFRNYIHFLGISVNIIICRIGLVQAATLAPSSSLANNRMMYIMTMLLPLVSINSFDIQWRCTPSAVLHTTELFLVQLARLIAQARAYVRRLGHDQIARDLFATAMDIVLVIYAIGFLFLSLYQASIFA